MDHCMSNRFESIDGFGEELDELVYEGLSSWLLSFRGVHTLFKAHFSYMVVFVCIITCGGLTIQHAKVNGTKFIHFWLGAMLYGILSENGVTATKHWHAQAPIMLFGKRMPLHMVFFYPTLLYLGAMGVQKFQLNAAAEPAAVGMLVMLMEIPYRIISVKFLHITYHDSDPLYFSKFCGVPWIEILSSTVFASSYVYMYHYIKNKLSSEENVRWRRILIGRREELLSALAGFVTFLPAFLQKVLFFHILSDVFNVCPASCFFLLCAVYFAVLFCFPKKSRNPDEGDKSKEDSQDNEEPNGKIFLYSATGVFVLCLLCISLFGKPENEISMGLHEPTGDCTTLICSRSPFGKVIKRKKYLCVDDVSERYNFVYTFCCLPDGPPFLNAIWYTICGTAMRNRAQFLTNIWSFVIVFTSVMLKCWLTPDEINSIKEKLASLRSGRILPRRDTRDGRSREAVVTFEEPAQAPEEVPAHEEPSNLNTNTATSTSNNTATTTAGSPGNNPAENSTTVNPT